MSSTRRPHDITCPYQSRGDIPECCKVAFAFDATMLERQRCARIAETEEELEGVPPEDVIEAMLSAGPVENARSAVRATKASIARRIRVS